MIKNNFESALQEWIDSHSEPSDCEHCSDLRFWTVAKISAVAAISMDIHDKRIASRDIQSPQVALLECNNCKRVTIIDEDKLRLSF